MATSKEYSFRVALLLLPVLLLLIAHYVSPATGDVHVNATQPMTTHHDTTGDEHGDNSSDTHGEGELHSGHEGVHVASWNLEYVYLPLVVTFFALFVGVAKIGFHHANFLSAILPESVLLIVIGVIFGGIAFATGTVGRLESKTFFLYLLPPIILEAAYSLHDRTFLDNLVSILMYAVVGTLLNTFLIGLTLYGISLTGVYGSTFNITLIECLVFSSLISAVDPVAVLAIFQEINVNQVLYFMVFGESLLNDAVTVVLYNMMNSFLTLDTIPISQIALGFVSFFTVSLGGAVIGFIVGFLTAFLTRFTKHVRVVEPLAVLGMAYFSYLLAELFHFSGIISIICCGLAQAQYAFANISRKSSTTVTYFTKMLSTTTESLIFLQLGQTLWAEKHQWNTGFVLFTLFFIFIYRAFGVVVITFIVNKFRIYKINKEEQFIMSYGGLRGAVAFSLVATLSNSVPVRNVLVTTTLVVILTTVFVQGITIKPLVKLFRIKRNKEEPSSVVLTIHQTVSQTSHRAPQKMYLVSGPNSASEMLQNMTKLSVVWVCDGRNQSEKLTRFWTIQWQELRKLLDIKAIIRIWLDNVDNRFMKRYLQREPTSWEDEVMKTFEKITNHDHHNHIFKVSRGEESRKDSMAEIEKFKPMLTRDDSYFDSIRRRKPFQMAAGGEYTVINDKTTLSDLAGIIRKNPSDALHQRYDRNLLKDDKQDLPMLMTQRSQEHSLARERISTMTAAAKWKHAIKEVKGSGMMRQSEAVDGGRRRGRDGDLEEDVVITGIKENDRVVKVDFEIGGSDSESKL